MVTITMSSGAEWRLFPPPLKSGPPSVGDQVFVRTKSAKEIGKKGVVFAFEKVQSSAVVDPATAKQPAKTMAVEEEKDSFAGSTPLAEEGAGAHSRDSNCDVDRDIVWRHIKKQKKKKKAKKFEDTRAVIRISVAGNTGNPVDCLVRPSRLVPIYGLQPPADSSPATAAPLPLILLTADTLSYRLLAASQVRASDKVLEVGCSTGETTVVLAKYVSSGRVVALDVARDMVAATKERLKLPSSNIGTHARVAVLKIDPFLDPRGAVEATEDEPTKLGDGRFGNGSVDAVFIDIGGNREVRGVVRMIAFVRTAFVKPPRLIVVKSQELVGELKASSDAFRPAATVAEAGSCAQCGRISDGDLWFRGLLERSTLDTTSGDERTKEDSSDSGLTHIPKHFHPNKAPLRLSPMDDVTPICRYHNYHREGCKKGERCPFDHSVCHWCLRPGHVALLCDDVSEFSVQW